MNRKTTIFLFYTCIAIFAGIILSISFWIRSTTPTKQPGQEYIVDGGSAATGEWFAIERDLQAVNQAGEQVKLSDLRGKVWLVAEFFAVCPHCAVRNGSELREIYEKYKDHPDFHVVCVSVDPETDTPEKLKDYATALGADLKNWWFLNAGDAKTTHDYMENTLKFFGIRERSDPLDIEANGRYAHDLGFILVNRDFKVIGKWPLADARSEEAKQRDPGLYERVKEDLHSRIKEELEKNETPGI